MVVVKGLVWDAWNKEHIAKHDVSPDEVEEVFQSNYQVTDSYRKRLLVRGKTKVGKQLAIILSSEDKYLQSYTNGIYYVITAFEKEVEE